MSWIIDRCISFLHSIYRPSISYRIHCLCDVLYSKWLSNEMNVGNKVVFRRPITVIGGGRISIGDMTKICNYSILSTWDSEYNNDIKLIIGSGCNIGEFCHITAANKIVIGNGVLTGRWVTISDNSHGNTDSKEELMIPPQKRIVESKGQVNIGNNVWIGDKVTVLAGVSIGDGAVVGANSVVTKDIPPYSVAVGNPIRIIKTLTT